MQMRSPHAHEMKIDNVPSLPTAKRGIRNITDQLICRLMQTEFR